MKYIVFGLFVVAALAAPTPDNGDPVELIVNGVPEGQALDIQDVVDIKVKEHVDGVVVANTDLLYPLSSVGIAEAIAAEEAVNPAPVEADLPVPEETSPVLVAELPSPVLVAELPSPVLVAELPSSVGVVDSVDPQPEFVQPEPVPIIIEETEANPEHAPIIPIPILPEPIETNPIIPPVIPLPVMPDIPTEEEVSLPEPAPIPEPVAQVPTGEVYNDGLVQIHVNAPEEATIFSTIQSWFSLVVNYISNGIQTAQQIV